MHGRILITILALAAAGAATAGPADYIYTPTVEYGEREVDLKFGSATRKDTPRESAFSIGHGWGAKEWWFTEVYLKYKRENAEGTKFDAIEWENKFQLTETGRYPVDLGFLLEVERPRDHAEGWELKWGPLLQKEFGRVQANANLLFERSYRAALPADTVLQYQWQLKDRLQESFEYGVQAFGEMGKWNAWSPAGQRVHLIGPAVFGKLRVGEGKAIRYNAAWLVGASNAEADHVLRMQLEYEY